MTRTFLVWLLFVVLAVATYPYEIGYGALLYGFLTWCGGVAARDLYNERMDL